MSKNKKSKDTKLKENNLQIGEPYIVNIKSGSNFTGVLIAKCENLKEDNETIMIYRFFLGGERARYIDLYETDIQQINEIVESNTEEYFQEFHDKYGVKCFNDGELLSASFILRNVIFKNGLWDGLSQEEKEELMNHLRLDAKDVIDLTTALISCKKENEKMHNEKLKILDATTELMHKYDAVKKVFTDTRDSYNVFFNMLGMDQFIKEICK